MTITQSIPVPVPAGPEVQTESPSNLHLHGDHPNESSLLHEGGLAKSISVRDPGLQRKVDAIRSWPRRYARLKSALLEAVLTDRPLSHIAREHSYAPAAMTYWIKNLGLPHRRRGRRALLAPTEQHRRAIALARKYGITEAARRCGVSKQRVSQIVYRWLPKLSQLPRVGKAPKLIHKGPPRNIIVSFRISAGEWERLLVTKLDSDTAALSGFRKARAIVLNHLGQVAGDAGAPVTHARLQTEVSHLKNS